MTSAPHASKPYSPLLGALLLTAAIASGGCATAPRKEVVYPPPPDTGRIRLVQHFQTENDLKPGFWSRLAAVLFPDTEASPLVNCYGIALSPDEKRLYVSVGPAKRVMAVDRATGDFLPFGYIEDNRLRRPIGIGTDAEGNIYVSDRDNAAVFVYGPDLKLARKFGQGLLKFPTLLTVDKKNQLVYVINDAEKRDGEHTVEVFSLKGERIRTIGGPRGSAEGNFNFPKGLVVSPAGELYVADTLNFRVQVFDKDGRFLRAFGEQGLGVPGKFDKIQGLAFDTLGDLYVVDSGQGQGVQILNDRLQPLMGFHGGLFQVPLQIAIDSQNHIFVTDFINGVLEFALINTTKEDTYARPAARAAPAEPKAASPAENIEKK